MNFGHKSNLSDPSLHEAGWRPSRLVQVLLGFCVFLIFSVALDTLPAWTQSLIPRLVGAAGGSPDGVEKKESLGVGGDENTGASLDKFGGCINCGVKGKKTGFFHVEKINGRWWFIDPLGNPFWMRAVQNIDDPYFPGPGKYPKGKREWAAHVKRRLQHWGFNALGEYASLWVINEAEFKMPYIGFLRPADHAMRNVANCAKEAVKEIVNNIPPSTYADYRGQLIDAYDPKFLSFAACDVDREFSYLGMGNRSGDSWLIGWTIEDGDQWFGVSGGDMSGFPTAKPHPGWMVLVSQDPAKPVFYGPYGQKTYKDLTNYSKHALRDFLKKRYQNDLSALNTAWGSSYTSWEHDGGYGAGTGLLDEWGGHRWVCSSLPCGQLDWRDLASMTTNARADLDAYLKEFTSTMASVGVKAILRRDKNHMVFSPDAFNGWGFAARKPALEGLAEWVDVINVSYSRNEAHRWPGRLTSVRETYDITGKPIFCWIGFPANPDSAMHAGPNPWGTGTLESQADRARSYTEHLNGLLDTQGSNGDYPVIGIDWWSWGDMPTETANWGLVTVRDNAYDGQAAVAAIGADRWGYPTGREDADYGDFLGPVAAANRRIYEQVALANKPNPAP